MCMSFMNEVKIFRVVISYNNLNVQVATIPNSLYDANEMIKTKIIALKIHNASESDEGCLCVCVHVHGCVQTSEMETVTRNCACKLKVL